MGNIVKFGGTKPNNSIRSGSFNIAVNSTASDLTGFYNGITPIIGGYTIYIDKASNGPSIYTPQNDNDLITITKQLGGSVSTAAGALVWINSQSNMTIINSNYPSIVTDGLVLNLDAGFVSSYPKGGTGWSDLSGNANNGTLINGVSYNSENGGSLVFDGVNDSVNCGSQSSLNLTNLTLSIWFKTTTATNQVLIGKAHMTSYYMNSSSGGLSLWTAGSSLGTSTGNLADGNWHYAVGTMNGTQKKIYADGVLLASNTGTIPSIDTNDLFIGRSATVNIAFNGGVLNSQVYNRALSDAEVLQNYYAGLERFIPTNGLVLSLDAQNTNLYATSPTTAYDVSGNYNNGTLTNGVQYVGNGNGSWNFDAVDDFIDNVGTTSSFSFIQNTGIFTICAWVRLTEFSTTQRAIMGNNRNATTERGFLLARGTSSSRIRFVITNGTDNVFSQQYDNYFLDDNWVFVTIVGNGTNVIYYRNGTLFQNGPNLGTLATGNSTRTLSVGRVNNLTLSLLWSGNISQTSIYNRALTATEISTIYNATRSRYGI